MTQQNTERDAFELTDAQIEEAFKNTNFGSTDFRKLLIEGVEKTACGWHNGWTMTQIIRKLNLGTPHNDGNVLNDNGLAFLYQAATARQEARIAELEMITSEQKLIIHGLKGECSDMGTTDICVALSRKDTHIKTLETKLAIAVEALEAITYSHDGYASKKQPKPSPKLRS